MKKDVVSDLKRYKEELKSLKERSISEINKFKEFFKDEANFPIDKDYIKNDEIPYFIGGFISDGKGKTILMFETEDQILEDLIKKNMHREKARASFDIQLIPMFISAIKKFSEELSIKDLSGLKLKGINMKMRILDYQGYCIILLLKPDTKISYLTNQIDNFFNQLINKNSEKFEQFTEKGYLNNTKKLETQCSRFFKNLNSEYERKISNLEIFDLSNTNLGAHNPFLDILNLKFLKILDKLRKMKENFGENIKNNNLQEIKTVAKKLQKINLILD